MKVWKGPISFGSSWMNTDTSYFDELADSWYEKRKEFKEGNKDYEDFLNTLKRQHAIDTGVIEKLYDLSEGITQTFIKEGFVEAYISHGDTNISSTQLINYLNSHLEAIDFVFDVVKNNRPLTKSFICELHQLIMRHQQYIEAIDSLGQIKKVAVLKGKFKEHPNNPKREDGTVYEYCPPFQVESEMDNLLSIYEDLEKQNIHPIIIGSWFHHAFTQIHPFQDGNGRIARLLTSLILIKHQLFPLNVLRYERPEYIHALENADNGNPNDLVKLFSKIQRRSIEQALNIQSRQESLLEVAHIFTEKIKNIKSRQENEKLKKIQSNAQKLIETIHSEVKHILSSIKDKLDNDSKDLIGVVFSDETNYYYYTKQIADYAKEHGYFFNKNIIDRYWIKIFFEINNKRYNIIITIHHWGYTLSAVAIGGFIEFKNKQEKIEQTISLNIKPYMLSLEKEIRETTKNNIKNYLEDLIKIGMSIITNEI